jgi:hypothetical protein
VILSKAKDLILHSLVILSVARTIREASRSAESKDPYPLTKTICHPDQSEGPTHLLFAPVRVASPRLLNNVWLTIIRWQT